MSLSPQKQAAVDAAVRKAIGPKAAVVKQIGCRYISKKWGNYQQFLLDDGRTAFVNLDADPLTVKVSEKPNAMHFGRYKRSQERAEKRLAKKAAKAVKVVKFDPKLSTIEGGSMRRKGSK